MKPVVQDLERSGNNTQSPNDFITITSSESIAKTLVGLYPKFRELSKDQIIQISAIIKSYIFGEAWIIEIITSITTPAVINFLSGIKNIVEENAIENIDDLEANIKRLRKDFQSSIICP